MDKLLFYGKVILAGMLTGLCNGLFGSGGGTIAVPAMVHFLGFEEHDAHATALAVILPLTMISSFIYFKNDFFDWGMIWKVALGGVGGGLLGAWLLPKLSSFWLRKIFGIFMIIAAVRMLI